jgi:hypothetical protein
VRRRRVGGGDLGREVQVADLVGERRVDGSLLQDPGAVKLAAAQERSLEPQVVAGRRVQTVPAGPVVRVLVELDITGRPGAVLTLEVDRRVPAPLAVVHAEAGLAHAQRAGDAVLDRDSST